MDISKNLIKSTLKGTPYSVWYIHMVVEVEIRPLDPASFSCRVTANCT